MISLAMCVAMLAFGSAALAQPTTQPGSRAFGEGPRRGRFQYSEEEAQRAMDFAQEQMPNTYAMILELPSQSPRRGRLMGLTVERNRRAQRLQKDSPEQFDRFVARLKAQDEVLGLTQRIQAAAEDQKPALQEELRAKMRQVVQGWMEERQERIEDLQRQLEKEKQRLERDNQDIDRLANQHMERLLGELKDAHLSPEGMPPSPHEMGMPPGPDGVGPATEPSDSRRPRRRD
jgi:hypothetical protein